MMKTTPLGQHPEIEGVVLLLLQWVETEYFLIVGEAAVVVAAAAAAAAPERQVRVVEGDLQGVGELMVHDWGLFCR